MNAKPFMETLLSFGEWREKIGIHLHPYLKTREHLCEEYEEYAKYVEKLKAFYQQTFTTDMLVNPVQKQEFKTELNEEENQEVADIVFNWQQAELLRLFDGFEKNLEEDGEYYANLDIEVREFRGEYFVRQQNEETIRIKTINDLVNICNLTGANLQWNESNNTEAGNERN